MVFSVRTIIWMLLVRINSGERYTVEWHSVEWHSAEYDNILQNDMLNDIKQNDTQENGILHKDFRQDVISQNKFR